MYESHLSQSVKILQSRNGSEYDANEMKALMQSRGIIWKLTVSGNPY